MPFANNTFDFPERPTQQLLKVVSFTFEILLDTHAQRVAVVHIRAKNTHCFSSFIDLFNCCKLVA